MRQVLVDIAVKDYGTLVVDVIEGFGRKLSGKKFSSEVNVWKEEIYFTIPISIAETKTVHRVSRGDVTYWAPGSALCVFYGYSQPYTPVIPLGFSVSPVHHYYSIKDGAEVEVKVHEERKHFFEETKILRDLNYTVATAEIDGYHSLVACKRVEEKRLSVEICIEDYGYYIETEPFFTYGRDPLTVLLVGALREIASYKKYLRVDVSEDNYVCLSACCEKRSELPEALKELEETYVKALSFLRSLYLFANLNCNANLKTV
ncbi:MAG: hypothetical protein DRJ63_06510 [Thermoprotei archaeon]|nr:MAG: hypothetical protein DRJ63_06510 [Thermoprotei archaeon]